MSFYLDTNFVISILFADARTSRAFVWLNANESELFVGDWTATETFALVNRRSRSGLIAMSVAQAALGDFDTFVVSKLAIAADGGRTLVTFDARLADAARTCGLFARNSLKATWRRALRAFSMAPTGNFAAAIS